MRIQVLPPLVANQIAAGEVIENPSSVVKELLENALDAQAQHITIDIGFGGLNHIVIADDGKGIFADDLSLAVAPHATSKLTSLDELANLSSMGFRGEALASIASVSRLIISSKPKEQDLAMRLTTEGGGRFELLPCARNPGTTIEVRDLFFNAPVRRRFLKSERSEYLSIEQVVKRFALCVPSIALQLKHNGKVVFDLSAAFCEKTQRLRIQKILGKAFIDASVALEAVHLGMHLKGFISTKDYQRSQNDRQWIYLNQRMVKDKLLFHAFRQAYENQLHPGRHPACVLYLTMPSADVDVNVHPTKHEVRFLHPRLVHDFVGSQIQHALASIECPSIGLEREPFETSDLTFTTPDNAAFSAPALDFRHQTVQSKDIPFAIDKMPSMAVCEPNSVVNPAKYAAHNAQWLILNVQFAILSAQSEHFLIDLLRLNQAYQTDRLREVELPLPSRPLLIPIRFPWLPTQQDPQSLKEYGLSIERFEDHVMVRTIPILFPQLNVTKFLQQVLSQPLSKEAVIACFVSAQYFDPYQLSFDEKERLSAFALQHQLSSQGVCIALDRNRCLELFHD